MSSPAKPTVGLVNLGCVRNTVDAQNILGRLKGKGYVLSASEESDVIIINTCSFIADAKKESLDAIVDIASLKKQGRVKKIIVAGCLAERYAKELSLEFPEVDAFVGTQRLVKDSHQEDVTLTPPHYAYLKICESCFNACSFCIIPKLKGRFASRDMDAIIDDARRMDREGAKEINIVGQDITAYGMDLYREKKLAELVRRLVPTLKSVEWVRLLYAYPSHVTDELLDVMASESRVCRYLDIPLQHVNDRVLKSMDRGTTRAKTVRLIEKIRRKLPGISLRTAFIVGFPGETDAEFQELLGFVQEYPFERVGVFTYSSEEGTKAYDLPGRIPEKVKHSRRAELMRLQKGISVKLQEKHIGRELKVLVEKETSPSLYVARSEYDAPDIDGAVKVRSKTPLIPGEFVTIRVTSAGAYDLTGDAVL